MPSLNIIIPVNNRPKTLERALSAIEKQEILPSWRVHIIVVNDGSSPEITQVVNRASRRAPTWCTYLCIDILSRGVSTARNQALAASSAPLILFLGADIFLRPGVLRSHLHFHLQHPQIEVAALGAVKWDPESEPNALMEWMTHGGSQNDFDNILGDTIVDPAQYFYASHISLKRAVLPKPAFDTTYQGYGWEDVDLGQQLVKKGLKLYFLPQAIGLHHHYYSVSDVYNRQRAVGRNFSKFQEKHKLPNTLKLTSKRKIRLWIFKLTGASFLLRQFLQRTSKNYTFPRFFIKFTAEQFWWGVWKAEKEKVAKVR